jgi:hypothetical protein
VCSDVRCHGWALPSAAEPAAKPTGRRLVDGYSTRMHLATRWGFSRRLTLSLSCFRRHITLSAVEGARDPPLDNRTLPDYFSAEILSRRPERPALICSHERPRAHGGPLSRNMGVDGHLAWDFSEFDSHITALTRGLVGLGVKKGDRVGVVMGNTRHAFPMVVTTKFLASFPARTRCCSGPVRGSGRSSSP